MHRLTGWVLDVSPSPYYIYWFESSYLNVLLNRDRGPPFLQCMNGIQGTKTFGRQCKIILNAVVTIIKYKKSPIDSSIYIKVFFDVIMSYLTVSTDDVLNTTNNEIKFTELTRAFEEYFEMKVQEGYVLKYPYFRILQYPLGFSVDQTDQIMEL